MSALRSPLAGPELHGPAVTGIGAVTGYGWGEKHVRDGLYSARSAVSQVVDSGREARPDSKWMAVVSDEGDETDGPDRLARAARFATRQAINDAWERGWRPSGPVGLVHAVARSATAPGEGVLARISQEHSLGGPTTTITGGATAGLAALITAGLWIDAGMAEDVVVLASDLSAPDRSSTDPSERESLHTEAPARVVCRPFQEGSIGPNPGEASVAVVLSRRSQGAYGVLAGGAMARGTGTDMPDRVQLSKTVAAALTDAGVSAPSVTYLDAHGSGAPRSDAAEVEVLDGVLAGAVGVYSLKPLVGDCGAASGLVELLAPLYGFVTGVVPAPPRATKGHARLLDGPTATVDGPVVKTSLGTGGDMVAVVLRPPAA